MTTTPPGSMIGDGSIQSLVVEAAETPLEGCFVELGVYKGGSAWHLAKLAEAQGREIFLYDTFTGIPFKGEFDVHKVGDFGDTSAAQVQADIPYAHVIVGVFPASLVPMPRVAFAHIDADQYQSIRDACRVLGPMMLPGGKMVFDDVWLLAGATRALQETLWPTVKSTSGKAMVQF